MIILIILELMLDILLAIANPAGRRQAPPGPAGALRPRGLAPDYDYGALCVYIYIYIYMHIRFFFLFSLLNILFLFYYPGAWRVYSPRRPIMMTINLIIIVIM